MTVVGPNQQGILTLETGNIDIFSDQSLLLAQSRVFTEQGGGIVIWSSNGDINAGQGAKTTTLIPPLTFTCDVDDFCTINPAGEVTGAGIATLETIAGAPPANANLMAPRGTVDAGAASIRVSGNLNIAALFVLNAFNIQVQGVTVGIPTTATPSIGALTAAGNVTGATQAAMQPPASTAAGGATSVVIVEVIGYGGGDAGNGTAPDQPQQPRKNDDDRRSDNVAPQYRDGSAVQIAGYGLLNDAEAAILTPEERARLIRH